MESWQPSEEKDSGLVERIITSLWDIRAVTVGAPVPNNSKCPLDVLDDFVNRLREADYRKEADVLDHVAELCKAPKHHGGLNLGEGPISQQEVSEIAFLVGAWLESLNSADRSTQLRVPVATRSPGRRPMTLTEKIFAMHNVEPTAVVRPGDTIRVHVDWIMASEASWGSMERTYEELGQPGIFRNDRFWLAGDHVVDPRVNMHPAVAKLIQSSERAKRVFKMTDYKGMNYTIMHTEFYRERAQPGMIVIGSDSHTCSSGAVGCLAIGLGAADVTMALVTGEIWFKVPECVNIRLVGKPGRGISGKDVILHILQQLKRNTVAADRVVEYTGPGLQYLSPDARFAICNMTTEFGGISGIFVPDSVTHDFINTRRVSRHKSSSHYFRPDEDAVYIETHVIDLSETKSFVAKYPNPDDVVPVSELEGSVLDGCFIGACTTAEEDIVLGALVLEQGLKHGLAPVAKGKRKVVPGSLPILDSLRKSGLAEVYEKASFEIGIPGCSYCVGMSADRAGEGEMWLSSQNRNFENRMGQGSIGNLASAATVAASSFEMKIKDPQDLIDGIDASRWANIRGRGSLGVLQGKEPHYVEPPDSGAVSDTSKAVTMDEDAPTSPQLELTRSNDSIITGKIQRLGDFVDTDALAPAQFLVESRTDESLGTHCLEFTHPDFRERVKLGHNIVVAGKAFGCGSSREQAVSALLGCGVKCVIARSFAFIYSRNQPSLGLLGITMDRQDFFDAAQDGFEISIDVAENKVIVDGQEFGFQLSKMEKQLIDLGGVTPAFMKFGKQFLDTLCSNGVRHGKETSAGCGSAKALDW